MDYFSLFTTAFFVGLSGAIMPGPMLTVTISQTPKRGFKVGPQIVLGHGLVELLLVICLAGGLTYYLRQSAVTGIIGIVGGLVLLWFGWETYHSARSAENPMIAEPEAGKTTSNPSIHPIFSGILLSVSNPYWVLWWATIGASYVVVALHLGTIGLVTFFAGHILSDLAWFSFVSFIIKRGHTYISHRLYQGVLVICAVFLALLGCWFFYAGLNNLALLAAK